MNIYDKCREREGERELEKEKLKDSRKRRTKYTKIFMHSNQQRS